MLALSALLLAAAAPASELVVTDPVVPATVNDQPARLRIDPGAPSMPVFNPDFAASANFRGGWIRTQARIGPVRIRGRSAVIGIDLGSGLFNRRTTWFDAPYMPDADGSIGPGGVPAQIVRFEIHAPVPGEHQVTMPLADFGWNGLGLRLKIGGETMAVQFALDRDRTLATASAGAAIANVQDGAFDGAPDQMVIALAVSRPVRHLLLRRPLVIGPLTLTGLMVRTGDFGSVGAIPDANAPEGDPDEIVVTGQRRQKRMLNLTIGRDYLNACSSIVFNKKAKTVTLSCV